MDGEPHRLFQRVRLACELKGRPPLGQNELVAPAGSCGSVVLIRQDGRVRVGIGPVGRIELFVEASPAQLVAADTA